MLHPGMCHNEQPLTYSDLSEKSFANCRIKYVLTVRCYAEKDQKGTEATEEDLGDLGPRDHGVCTAPRDLKDQWD